MATEKKKPADQKTAKTETAEVEARKVGRPSDFKPEYAEQAKKLCLLGATDKELADFFGVCEATINNWKVDYREFLESIRAGKEIADAEIAHSLFHRAKGYSHPEVDIRVVAGEIVQTPLIKHYPPDTDAAKHWLNNRQKDKWRSKIDQEITGANGGPVEITRIERVVVDPKK